MDKGKLLYKNASQLQRQEELKKQRENNKPFSQTIIQPPSPVFLTLSLLLIKDYIEEMKTQKTPCSLLFHRTDGP